MCSVLLNLDLRFRFIHLPNMCSSVSFAVLPQNMQSSEGLMAKKVSKTGGDDQFDERESTARFEAALKSAMNTPHKPLKEKPKVKKVAKPNYL
jgi:hypothetical protein